MTILVPCSTDEEVTELMPMFSGYVKIRRPDWVEIEHGKNRIIIFTYSHCNALGLRGDYIMFSSHLPKDIWENVLMPALCIPERLIKSNKLEELKSRILGLDSSSTLP